MVLFTKKCFPLSLLWLISDNIMWTKNKQVKWRR
jgi:hypothetical protein